MNRASATVGSIVFFLIAPCTVAGIVPWWISRWQFMPPFLDAEFTRVVGAVLTVAGAAVLVDSFARFALQGLGTPAPVLPPRHLVVSGLYRHVRNPMYVGLVSAILGQALLFADTRLLLYGALVWLACHTFVVLYEEPTLARTFGAQYEAFRAHVPRWIPRMIPWRTETGAQKREK